MSRMEFIEDKVKPEVSGAVIRVTSKQKALNTVRLINKLNREGYMVLMNFRVGDLNPCIEVGCFNGLTARQARLFHIPIKFLKSLLPMTQAEHMGDMMNDMMKQNQRLFEYVEQNVMDSIEKLHRGEDE